MFSINKYLDGEFEIVELKDEKANSWVKLCPERGGIATGFGVDGKELFYMDPATFHQPGANIRGGNPVLFPICGQLPEAKYEWNGQTYPMKNHGFARDLPWDVVATNTDNEASATLRLGSNDETRKYYPFDFELSFTYILKGTTLRIVQQYRNLSDQPMPMYAGFHPYFLAEGKEIAYETDATRYWDYNDGQEKAYEGKIDLDLLPESIVFLDAKENRIAFELPGLDRKVTMEYSEPFRYVVLWSVKGKPFVCVEPWMAKTGESVAGHELQMIAPGQSLTTELNIIGE